MTDEDRAGKLAATTGPAWLRRSRLTAGWLQALGFLTGVVGIAIVLLGAWAAGSEFSRLVLVFVVLTIFWFALWLVIFVSREPSARDIGQALLTGLVLAGAAFLMNTLLSEAIEDRNRDEREIDTRLAINQGQRVFRSEDLSGFDLTGLDMSGTVDEPFDLAHANLREAVLARAQLRNARLERTDLSRADLSEANLVGAVLTEARLDGADLTGANLSGADLKGSEGFAEADDMILDATTRCPDDPQNNEDEPADYFAHYSREREGFTCDDADDLVSFDDDGSPVFVTSPTTPAGTPIGQVIGSDPDGDTLTYSIASISCSCEPDRQADENAFTLDPSTGVLRAGTLMDVDGESLGTDTELTLAVDVDDGSAVSATLDVTVLLTDVNEPPEVVLSFLVPESSNVGREIGRIQAPEGTSATFFIESPGDELFEIDADGRLTLSHEPQADETHLLTVRISHDGDSSFVRVIVRVTATNLPPALTGPEQVTLPQSSPTKTLVATITGTDPDGDLPPDYALTVVSEKGDSDAVSAMFAINPDGEITLERELDDSGSYMLLVEATDTGFPARSSFLELQVEVIDDPS